MTLVFSLKTYVIRRTIRNNGKCGNDGKPPLIPFKYPYLHIFLLYSIYKCPYMSAFNQLDFYKEVYYKEIERKCDLSNDLSLPIGIISILSTVFFFFLSTFDYKTNHVISVIFILFATIGIAFIIASIIYLILAYDSHPWAKPYDYLAFPNEIAEFYDGYMQYFQETESNTLDIPTKTDKELEKYLLKAFIRTATVNMKKTDTRSSQLHKSKSFLLVSFILLLLAFVPFLINNFTKTGTSHRVEISNKLRLDIDSSKPQFNSKILIMPEDKDSAPKSPPKPPDDRHVRGTEPAPPKPAPAPTKPSGGGQ